MSVKDYERVQRRIKEACGGYREMLAPNFSSEDRGSIYCQEDESGHNVPYLVRDGSWERWQPITWDGSMTTIRDDQLDRYFPEIEIEDVYGLMIGIDTMFQEAFDKALDDDVLDAVQRLERNDAEH